MQYESSKCDQTIKNGCSQGEIKVNFHGKGGSNQLTSWITKWNGYPSLFASISVLLLTVCGMSNVNKSIINDMKAIIPYLIIFFIIYNKSKLSLWYI